MTTPPPPSRAELLLSAALDHSPEERESFLAEACEGDVALLSEVRALLATHEATTAEILHTPAVSGEDLDATLKFSAEHLTNESETGAESNKDPLDGTRTLPLETATANPTPNTPSPSGPAAVLTAAGANPDSPTPFVFGNRIAQGAMGAILTAKDCKLGRTIAVKVMLDEVGGSEEQQLRFVQEAAVLGKLQHPNIVPVYDLGRDAAGSLYYSMKLVKGRTLQDILNDLRAEAPTALAHYTLERLLTVFRKICDALAFAHAEDIIHRDLKPENIMVGEFGEVLVMDWGLSKILDGTPELPGSQFPGMTPSPDTSTSVSATLEGSVMGTPQYMSPEQAAGEIAGMDSRSDIYSLGGLLYAILTLRPPVEGTDVYDVLAKVQAGDLTPISTFGATATGGKATHKGDVPEARKIKPLPHVVGGRVPPALSAVAMKALSLDKKRRYQRVSDLNADIEKWQGGFATSAEGAGLGKQLALLIKRHKAVFTTAAAAWLLITALAVWFVFNLRAKEQRAVAGEAAAKAAEAFAMEEKKVARQSSARANLALAEAALRDGDGPAIQAALGEVPEDLRDSTHSYLLDQSDDSIARIETEGGQIESVAAHPRRPGVFAIVDSSGKVILIDVRTGTRLLEFEPDFPPTSDGLRKLAFSPDGEHIAVGRPTAHAILIHSARDGKKLLEWEVPGTEQLEFSPDATLLLQTEGTGRIVNVLDVVTGQSRWRFNGGRGQAIASSTPDSQQVVVRSAGKNVRLLNAGDGSLVRTLGDFSASAITVRPDSKLAVLGGKNTDAGKIQGLFLQDGKIAFEIRPHDREIQHLAFTPDGSSFVSVAVQSDGRQVIQLWDGNTGAPLQKLLGGSGTVTDVSVHPLSGELAVSGQNSRAWNLAGTTEKWKIEGQSHSGIAFWGSDDQVLTTTAEYETALLKLRNTPELLWAPPSLRFRIPNVSADGRFAALAHGGSDHTIVVLRNPGAHTETVTDFDPQYPSSTLRLSPTGDRLATIEKDRTGVYVHDSPTGDMSFTGDFEGLVMVQDLGWLSGGRQLAGLITTKAKRGVPGSEEQIVLWDGFTGKVVQTATHPTTMDVLAVGPGGNRFAEAGMDKNVRIRDASTLAVQQEFRVHDGPITALAWHPAKSILATASTDLTVKIWNLETGRQMDELRGMLTAPAELAFSPSGRRLACAGNGAATHIWEPPLLSDQADNGEWEDLLAPLTPAGVENTGSGWRLDNGILYSTEKPAAILPLSSNLGGTSYTVRVQLRRFAGNYGFHLVLPVGDRMTGFDLDGSNSQYTGLQTVNRKGGKNLPGVVTGKQASNSEKHSLQVTVRLDGENATITTRLDGKPLYEWTGSTKALGQHSMWAGTDPGTLAVGVSSPDWMVSEVKMKRLKE